ncbi:MAG: hypothetical protein K5650_00300 [Bacteroidales bacterium]|nr:hypothetical protein [Bacteroidales bacterium]
MKTQNTRRLALWVLFMVTSSTTLVQAQEKIWSIGLNLNPTNAIIRNINNNSSANIVYYSDSTKHYFCYADSNSIYAERIELSLATNARVNDFEIFDNRYVVFCGTDGSDNAIVGYFDYSYMLSTSSIPYRILTVNTFIGYFKPTNFKRIEAFYAGGDVHFVMVGDCRCTSGDVNNSCVVDMFNSNIYSSAWPLYLMAKGKCNEYFDDIAVGDTLVATVGTATYSNRPTIRFYDKPTTSSTSIFNTTTCNTLQYFGNNTLTSSGIVHTEQDHFVTTFVTDNITGQPHITTHFQGQTLFKSVKITFYPQRVYDIKDIAYIGNHLYELYPVIVYTTNPQYYVIDYIPAAESGTVVNLNALSLQPDHIYTLDHDYNDPLSAYTAGNRLKQLIVHHRKYTDTDYHCYSPTSGPCITINTYTFSEESLYDKVFTSLVFSSFTAPKTTLAYTLICN